jgi:RNA polymerase-binding transcription factor DksA
MAKATKKSSAKPAKKKEAVKAKAKPSAKQKKSAPVKAKKVVAKKAAPKKEAPKKVAIDKKVKATEPKKVVTTGIKETVPVAPKPVPPLAQLTMFQMPNQRPIAHKPAKATVQDRSRYSDDELKEFEKLINGKLEKAREEYRILKETLNRNNDEGTDATSGGNTKVLEDGAETAEKENLSQLAARQQKYITNLENALVRIKNRTYGICSVTGKLIPKERLIAVPHTTQSIEAKMMQHD